MRKRYNRITWKVRHLTITFLSTQQDLAASSKRSLTKDQFINELVQFLVDDGYTPRLPVEIMKKRMKSPYSESESYQFLKIDESGVRIRLVLEIRWSQHSLKEYGNYSGSDRKLHHLDTKVIPDIGNEYNLDVSNTESRFINVVEQNSPNFSLVGVDDQFYNNYEEALKAICERVRNFDKEIS